MRLFSPTHVRPGQTAVQNRQATPVPQPATRFGGLSFCIYSGFGEGKNLGLSTERRTEFLSSGPPTSQPTLTVILYDSTQKGMAPDEVQCNGKRIGASKQVGELSKWLLENPPDEKILRNRVCDVVSSILEEHVPTSQAVNIQPNDLDDSGRSTEKCFTGKMLTAFEMFQENLKSKYAHASSALRESGTSSFSHAFSNYAGYFMLTIPEAKMQMHHASNEGP